MDTDRHVLDFARTALLGDPDTPEGRRALIEIFQLYFDNVAATCADMRRAAAADDVRKHAHRAKGASGVVGATILVRTFADLEARAAAGESIADETYDELEQELAMLRRQVSARLGTNL